MQTIDQLIARSCEQNSARIAFKHKASGQWQSTSYAELWDMATQAASGLIGKKLKPGEHAAIIAPSSPRWMAAYLGILRSGGVAVPIDKELKASELRHVLSDSEARVLFTETTYLETIQEILDDLPKLEKIILLDSDPELKPGNSAVEELVEAWKTLVERFKVPEDEVKRLETMARQVQETMTDSTSSKHRRKNDIDYFAPQRANLAKLIKAGRLISYADLPANREIPDNLRSADDTAVILYTSGTTGKSKGAMLSHANIVSNIKAAIKHFDLNKDMTTLSFLPINHVFEQVCGILLPLSLGGNIAFAESLKKLGENLAEVKPSFLLGVPAVYRLVLDRIYRKIQTQPLSRFLFSNPLTRPIVSSKVRKSVGANTTFVSGGAALDPAVAKGYQELGLNLCQGYGITETSPVIAAEAPGAGKVGTVGNLLENIEVRIDNANAEGVGEIVVKGPNVMQGYYKRPEATAEVLKDGWYRTGDLGKMEDGYLSICGRVKNLIVTPNGKNVYPEEIEGELLKSPYIAEVMVYGHKVSATAEEVYAVIFADQEQLDIYQREQKKPRMTPSEVEDLIRGEVLHAGKQLADYKRVKKFTLREDEFPKTTTRKIKRFVIDPQVVAAE